MTLLAIPLILLFLAGLALMAIPLLGLGIIVIDCWRKSRQPKNTDRK